MPVDTHRLPTDSRLHQWLSTHIAACFALMTLAFLVFGLLSLDLVKMVSANAGFLWRAGWGGLMDGGFMQLLELLTSALVGIACYIVFKLCEHVMVDWLSHRRRR